jgi:hypothetical protein
MDPILMPVTNKEKGPVVAEQMTEAFPSIAGNGINMGV